MAIFHIFFGMEDKYINLYWNKMVPWKNMVHPLPPFKKLGDEKPA